MKYCTVCKGKFDDSLSFCPADGEVLEEDPTSLLGSALDGQYQIESLLGKGGMGAVYLARHILLGDRVAIKVLPPEMRNNAEWLRRFQREGQAARRFRHTNAVTVYDLRTAADGTVYLVMEYVAGHTLDAELRKHGRFSPAEAVAVLEPIMSVLNAAHAMGVVHRDLKPENIMIGNPGTDGVPVVKLLDLGIAKMREVAGAEKSGATALTVAGQMLGTPYYMSPEQWGELPRDGSSDIDGRADIYSLGVVFYELVAGKRPFAGTTLSEMRRQHVSARPRLLHEFVPNVGERFSLAVARAMAKDRADRQATTGELATELKAALQEDPVSTTVADSVQTPEPGGPTSAAVEPRGGSATAVERGMPTVVTSGPLGTQGQFVTSGPDPVVAASPSESATMPTVISAPIESPAPLPETMAERPVAEVTRPARVDEGRAGAEISSVPPRRSPVVFVGVTVVLLLILAGGGFAILKLRNPNAANVNANNAPPKDPNETDPGAVPHEVGRYWFGINTGTKKNPIETAQVGRIITIPPDGQFKLHFSPSENGYVYIVGPGENNDPTIFLGAKQIKETGLKDNEAKSGVTFTFPSDTQTLRNWANVDNTVGTDEYTVVFSKERITSPVFFEGASFTKLSQEETNQWGAFLEKYKGNTTIGEPVTSGSTQSLPINVPQNKENMPAIFKFSISHQR